MTSKSAFMLFGVILCLSVLSLKTVQSIVLSTSSNDDYIGCYKDADDVGMCEDMFEDCDALTIDDCVQYCRRLGHPQAALFSGNQCWCGELSSQALKAPNSECDVPCPGNANEKCGGTFALSVYSSESTTKAPPPLVNVAVGKIASQSSNYNNNNPYRAIDGNTNSNWNGNSCSHTNNNQNAWWQVDLGDSYPVYQVIVYNRQDCCIERSLNLEVRIGTDKANIRSNTACGQPADQKRIHEFPIIFNCDGPIEGRYVSLQLKDRSDYLHVCEVKVMAPGDQELTNVAKGKQAAQSSNYGDAYAGRAVDGNANSAWSGGSCSHTNSDQNAWWRVDLGKEYPVDHVIVTNRMDCCHDRFLDAEVRVGNEISNFGGNSRCGSLVGTDRIKQETLNFRCASGVTGRYVSVQLKDRKNYLHICEVKVMSPGRQPVTNVAKGKQAAQSSNYGDAYASRAVDGNANSAWSGGSCSHTNSDQNAWWRVDLGKEYPVDHVIVTNRMDCCHDRFLHAEVRVGNEISNFGGNSRCGSLVGTDRIKQETLNFQCASGVTGRYISVQLKDRKNYLHICEVKVMSPGRQPVTNVAKGKQAAQSSNYGDAYASRAVDGNANSAWSGGSCSHTNSDQNAWWRVDLGKEYPVDHVIVTNRMDCCHDRFLDAEVRVGNEISNFGGNSRCGSLVGTDRIKQETLNFQCASGVTGRYVSVQLKDRKNYLHICEVKVMSPGNGKNLAAGKLSSQSSLYPNGYPFKAVDGDNNPTWNGQSCIHTQSNRDAWWIVDLGASHRIQSVVATNRQDCCGERIDGLVAMVGPNQDIEDNTQCGNIFHWSAQQSITITFTCNPAIEGRFVGVMLKDHTNYLHVCEVEVYGE
ncbi:uncharacterized protein LOC144443540 [Glandiceps talaboti]